MNSALAMEIGNAPVGPEYHVLHNVFKDWSVVVIGFADDHIHGERDFEIFIVRAQAKFRNIRDDRRGVKSDGQPAPALQSELHLPHASAKRHIQIGQSLRSDFAVRGAAEAALEMSSPRPPAGP